MFACQWTDFCNGLVILSIMFAFAYPTYLLIRRN